MTEQTCSFLPLPEQLGTAVSDAVPVVPPNVALLVAENTVPALLDKAPNNVMKLVVPTVLITYFFPLVLEMEMVELLAELKVELRLSIADPVPLVPVPVAVNFVPALLLAAPIDVKALPEMIV
jgi:hypothetical protein